MPIRFALAGNPNCGKTTIFNALTGSAQYVGNWPGVTVEKKEGKYHADPDIHIMDLPGVYSLSPYTPEEVVARDYLTDGQPDVIVNLVDATNMERNLYLTTQLLEIGIPAVIALNMMDAARKQGDHIDSAALSELLGVPVVETSAIRGEGVSALMEAAKRAAGREQAVPCRFPAEIEEALENIGSLIAGQTEERQRRWFAVKLFERDERVLERFDFSEEARGQLEAFIAAAEDALDDDAESLITSARYTFVAGAVQKTVRKNRTGMTTSDKIDRVVTNRILALPIFAAVMVLVYYIAVTTVGGILTDFTNDVIVSGWVQPAVQGFLEGIGTADWLTGLIVDGIVGGAGSVIGFVPQMLVLFLMLSMLEDCGYMARVAFIMDRIFRRFGLSGKSFIPMLIGMGCGVPGIMASRTIEQERDRRMTIMTTTFIPCGAKMPIIALLAGAVFGGAWWVAPSAFFVGIAAIVISGIVLKKTRIFSGEAAPFVMELPRYHVPAAGNVLRATWERGWSFIKKAGTIITLASVLVWFGSSFGVTADGFGMVEDIDASILAALGGAAAVLFRPLGFGSWQASVATVLGLVAKEEVVGAFGTLFGVAGDALTLVEEGNFGSLGAISSQFTALSAYSFMVFNLLCAPCFAAIGAIRREMNHAGWTWFAIGYQTSFAYAISLMIYQFGLFFTGSGFSLGTLAACLALAGLLVLLLRKAPDGALRRQRQGSALHPRFFCKKIE